MSIKLISKLTVRLTDWLFVILGVSFILWFGIRLPVFSVYQSNSNANKEASSVTTLNLRSHVKALIKDYAPRTLAYGNLNITAHYIHHELARYGQVHYQPYWTLAGRFSNVVFSLGPDTQEVFVIGAHYDAESDSLDVDGNASGVATLIELARVLSEKEDKLPMRVLLVAYPLSQKNITSTHNMGSYNHAELLSKQEKDVKLMISLDGVGRFNPKIETQHYPYRFMRLFYPNKGDYISLIGRLQDFAVVRRLKNSFSRSSALPMYSFNAPERYSLTTSNDHINYQKKGFPAVLISDTANYRAFKEGQDDVVDQLDYEKMSMLVKGLYHVVMESEKGEVAEQLVHQKSDITGESRYFGGLINKNSKKGGGVL